MVKVYIKNGYTRYKGFTMCRKYYLSENLGEIKKKYDIIRQNGIKQRFSNYGPRPTCGSRACAVWVAERLRFLFFFYNWPFMNSYIFNFYPYLKCMFILSNIQNIFRDKKASYS